MSTAEDLGKLIIMMNPYAEGSEDGMEPHTFVDAPSVPAPQTTPSGSASTTAPATGTGSAAGVTPAAGAAAGAPNPRRIWVEMDTRYPGEWSFKGQPHHVNRALRIAYRWPKKDKHGK